MDYPFSWQGLRIKRLPDGTLLITMPNGEGVPTRITDCIFDGRECPEQLTFHAHWDLDRLLESDAVLKILVQGEPGMIDAETFAFTSGLSF